MQTWQNFLTAMVIVASATAHAATITVTNNSDSGAGSLRNAVATADGDGAADVIEFDASLDGQTITLTSVGDTTYGNTALRITTPITIQATGGIKVAISGNNTIRPFYVTAAGSLTLIDLTIINGRHTGGNGGEARSDAGGGGGGMGLGGGALVEGTLNVSRCLFQGNTARGGNGGGYAAGVTNGGGGGGSILGNGSNSPSDGNGGGGAAGNATVGTGGNGGNTGQAGFAATGSNAGFGAGGGGGGGGTHDGNAGGFGGGGGGGGISANFTTGTGGFGGGNGTGAGGSGGCGAGFGGAIMSLGGTVSLSNSTFTGNTAAFGTTGGLTNALGAGGAIFARNGSVTLRNCTLSANTALQGGRSIYILGDGTSSTLTIYNTIAGQSTAGAAEITLNTINSGSATATGANSIVRQAAAVTGVTFQNVNPALGALADNGGPTQTFNLLPASPALNTGDNAQLGGATVDQRGLARILDDPSVVTDIVDIGAVESSNQTPTDLALSSSSVPENQPVATTVGTLSTTDGNSGDTFTYTLVAGAGDTDNAKFSISGADLRTAQSFDFETANSFSVRVRTTDSGGLTYEESVAITVTDVQENFAPTDITASASSVAENSGAGTTVGTLSTADADGGDTHAYTLVSGAGSTDNAAFTISGNTLKTAAAFDFEVKSSYSIRVRTTDSGAGALTFEKTLTIAVTNVNEKPVLGSFSAAPADALTGETVTFTVSASDPDGTAPAVTIDYGDGSSGTSLTHVYTTVGTYTVVVTASDGTLSDSKQIVVAIGSSDFNTDSFVGPMDTDTDRDGVPDAMEVILGTSPTDATDSPVSGAKPISFRMEKPKAMFSDGVGDVIEFKGVLHVRAGLNPVGAMLVIDAGGNVRKVELDARARFSDEDINFQLMAKLNANKAKEARFKLKISGELLENMIANAPKDEQGRPTQLTAHILFGGVLLIQTKQLTYRK